MSQGVECLQRLELVAPLIVGDPGLVDLAPQRVVVDTVPAFTCHAAPPGFKCCWWLEATGVQG